MTPTRRRFLQVGAALAMLSNGRRTLHAKPLDRSAERLLSVVGDRNAAARIGHAHLAAAPENGDADLVLRLLEVPEGMDAAWELEARRRADFRHGRVEPVEGWILSQTEIRLCVLAALA